MNDFIHQLKSRNETLFYFGLICFILSFCFFVLSKSTTTQLYNVNIWNKPLKFAVSLGIYSWTMAWYCYYLPAFNVQYFNNTVIVMWSFEILYITVQASRGLPSHFNVSTPLYSLLYGMMAMAATIVTVYTAYIGIQFYKNDFPSLPEYYVWAIRIGILLFVIFSFEGFLMGSRLNHSVGSINDNSNWFIIGWSKTVGDLRVAHFIGMHALQVLPILSYFILKNTKLTIAVSIIYGLLAITTLIQALQGRPLLQPVKTETRDKTL